MAEEGEQAAGLLDKLRSAVPVLNAGRDRLDTKQQSYRIDNRVALDALDLFARVVATDSGCRPFFGGLDGLGVDGSRGRSLAALGFTASHEQRVMDAVEHAVA